MTLLAVGHNSRSWDGLPGSLRALALALTLLLLPTQALAAGIGPRLLAETPVASALEPAAAQAPSTAPWLLPWLAGAGATAVAVPATLLLSARLGTASNQLALAALPALLLFAALPPLAATSAEWWVANRLAPGSWRFQPALWAALAAHVLASTAAALVGVSVVSLPAVALFTLVEVLLLPSTVTGVMRLTAPAPLPVSAALPLRQPEPLPGRPEPSRALTLPLFALAF